MAYANFAMFQGIPGLYASVPQRQRPRRTATNTMAGCFDPLPALASDSGGDDSSSSQESILTGAEEENAPGNVLAGAGRAKENLRKSLKGLRRVIVKSPRGNMSGKGDDSSSSQLSILSGLGKADIPGTVLVGTGRIKRVQAARKSLKGPGRVVKTSSENISGKGKQVRRVLLEEKENTMSDTDTSASLSPVPPPPSTQTTLPLEDAQDNKPKASGFWRARSSNTPEEDSSAVLKRKRSLFDDSSSPPTKKQAVDKPPSSEVDMNHSRFTPLSSSSDSLTSLDLGSQDAPTAPAPQKTYAERLTEMVLGYTEPFGKKNPDWVRCKICRKVFENRFYIEKHFKFKHSTIVDQLGPPPVDEGSLPKDQQSSKPSLNDILQRTQSAPPPQSKPLGERRRARRKNVAVKKGWKGWVEDELEPQNLILLDKPEVLPERTTRSGRKI